jgi:hypothetical protein
MSNTISTIVRERRSDGMPLLMNFVCVLYLKYQSECDSFCENGGRIYIQEQLCREEEEVKTKVRKSIKKLKYTELPQKCCRVFCRSL